MNLLFSLTLFAVGCALLIIGFVDAGGSFAAQISRLISGHSDGRTAWLVVAGCICAGVGLVGAARARFAKPVFRR